jgi:hypothetical protein
MIMDQATFVRAFDLLFLDSRLPLRLALASQIFTPKLLGGKLTRRAQRAQTADSTTRQNVWSAFCLHAMYEKPQSLMFACFAGFC